MSGGIIYPQTLTSAAFLIAVCSGVVFSVLVWLALRSGHGYSVHDTQAHSLDYGGVIREGHGGLTAFLRVTYAAIFVWCVYYVVLHWGEFVRLFSIFQQ